jgi:Cu/Ag efflux protein CusF
MKISTYLIAITLSFVAFPITAQEQKTSPAPIEKPAINTDNPELIDAEVRKVDKDAKRITLKHGAIKSLDMPAMSMVFRVNDPMLLTNIKAGDKVKFSVMQTKNGYVVTRIEAAK